MTLLHNAAMSGSRSVVFAVSQSLACFGFGPFGDQSWGQSVTMPTYSDVSGGAASASVSLGSHSRPCDRHRLGVEVAGPNPFAFQGWAARFLRQRWDMSGIAPTPVTRRWCRGPSKLLGEAATRIPALTYSRPVDPMPQPGDACPGFIAEAGRCWQNVYDRNLQATHCPEAPTATGRWFSPKGDRWFPVWACPEHLEGLTGLREFGRRR
jgi:hypothetical protein